VTIAASTRSGNARAPVSEDDQQATFNLRFVSVQQDKEMTQKIKAALYPTELADEMIGLKQTLQAMSDNLKAKDDCIDILEKERSSWKYNLTTSSRMVVEPTNAKAV
jgi:hypothetical protein